MENSSFSPLSGANSFCFDILAQPATSCSSFAALRSISDTPTAESFTAYSTTPIVSSLASNPGPISTPLTSIAAPVTSTQAFPSNVEAYEGRYKNGGDVKLSTILSESIVTTYGKIFVKTEDLAYFNKIKKYSKVWDHGTQLLEVQSKTKYWLYNYCMLAYIHPASNTFDFLFRL